MRRVIILLTVLLSLVFLYLSFVLAFPVIDNIVLNSTNGANLTSENLTVYTNLDSNSSIKLIYNWKKNNNSIAILNMPFESGSNSTWTRDYINSFNGSINGPSWNATGGHDSKGSYTFNGIIGSGDIINLDSFSYSGNSFSISLWVKHDGFTLNEQNYFRTDTESFTLRHDGATSQGQLHFYINAGGLQHIRVSGALLNNKWHHLVGTFDGSEQKLYIDGILNSTNIVSGSLSSCSSAFIGSSTEPMNGTIDDLIIYSHALSDIQVKALFEKKNNLIVSGEINSGDIWSACVVANDGINDSNSSCSKNLSIIDTDSPNIQINAPNKIENVSSLKTKLNISIDEIGNIWYNLNSLGNISLCNNCFNGTSDLDFIGYGNHSIIIYVNDSLGNLNSTYFNFNLVLDSDNDGIPDSIDFDDDNDGVNDSNDFLCGEVSNIGGNFDNLNISINGSTNLSGQMSGILSLKFVDGNESILEFDFDFDSNITLSLSDIVVSKQSDGTSGSIFVHGINLSDGRTKTVYLDDINSLKNSVCIKDSNIASIGEVSGDCNGVGEIRLSCPGTIGNYTCEDFGNRLKVSGLSHSGVLETNDVSSEGGSSSEDIRSSSGGCTADKNYDWKCGNWGKCTAAGFQTRSCNLVNNCGNIFGQPELRRDCGYRVGKIESFSGENYREIIASLKNEFDFRFYLGFLIIGVLLMVVWNVYSNFHKRTAKRKIK